MSRPFAARRRDLAQQSFVTLQRYWNDPAFAAQVDAEGKRLNDASMSAMDQGIARYRAERERVA